MRALVSTGTFVELQMSTLALIRPYEEADADEMTDAALESIAEVAPWMPWCHRDYSRADAAAWIRVTRDGHSSGAMYDFAIVDAAGRYAGGCGINNIVPASGVANLGYWVRTSLTGRGIAPAAVLQLVAWTFVNTRLNRLEIVAAIGNVRSQRVARSLGRVRQERSEPPGSLPPFHSSAPNLRGASRGSTRTV